MKNLLIFFFLSLCFTANAQEFERLIAKGDSLKNIGYYDRADQHYYRAMSMAEDKRYTITDEQWAYLFVARAETRYKAFKNAEPQTYFWNLRFKSKGLTPPALPERALYYYNLPPLLRGRKFHQFKTKADSLKARSRYRKALKFYDAAINEITSYKENVTEFDFMPVIYEASNTFDIIHHIKPESRQLINEKYSKIFPSLADKVKSLKIKHSSYFCSFEFNDVGSADVSYIFTTSFGNSSVSQAEYKYLVWVDGNELFIQAFSMLNITPPIKIDNKKLLNLLQYHYEDLLGETMQKMSTHPDHERYFTFIFYGPDGTEKKVKYQESDVKDPTPRNFSFGKDNMAVYKANIKTYLYQFQQEATEGWWQYNKRLKTDYN